MKKSNFTIKMLNSPYRIDESDSVDKLYERYLLDPYGQQEIDDINYYKTIESYLLGVHDKIKIVIMLDNNIGDLHIGDKLIDEKQNEYIIIGFEMIRFTHQYRPDWYIKTSFVALEGNYNDIGEYLAKPN